MHTLPDSRRLLVIAPHPDDEAIGAWGLIVRARRRGADVRVIVVTDGAGSHRASPSWPRARLVQERQRETRAAMRRIGVPASAVTFLGLPDGGLPRCRATPRRLSAAMRRVLGPLLLVGPAGSDDHPDHRVVATVLARTRRPGVRRFEYPVWPAGRAPRRAAVLPLGPARLAKRLAIRRYRTQAGLITDDPNGFAMTRAQIAAFSRPVELFVPVRP
jgi:LmbE family N-acetylglucosaminyl deacetylase